MEVETKPKITLSTGGALSHYKETMRISSPFQNDGDAGILVYEYLIVYSCIRILRMASHVVSSLDFSFYTIIIISEFMKQ
jgi:hypothetical protein